MGISLQVLGGVLLFTVPLVPYIGLAVEATGLIMVFLAHQKIRKAGDYLIEYSEAK